MSRSGGVFARCPSAGIQSSMVTDQELRQKIGDQWIAGEGFEIGPGLDPSLYKGVTKITFVDKRDRRALEALFRGSIEYNVLDLAAARAYFGTADFAVAHHVFEHLSNPIRGLSDWIALLKPAGRLFVSLPAETHACEKDRLVTPFEHILDDYLFERGDDHFDSKQHIPHFINQWTAMSRDSFWFAADGVDKFVTVSLSEVRRDVHDLHWHTYSAQTLAQVIEAAFWFSRRGVRLLHQETARGHHYLVAESAAMPSAAPAPLRQRRQSLAVAAGRIDNPK